MWGTMMRDAFGVPDERGSEVVKEPESRDSGIGVSWMPTNPGPGDCDGEELPPAEPPDSFAAAESHPLPCLWLPTEEIESERFISTSDSSLVFCPMSWRTSCAFIDGWGMRLVLVSLLNEKFWKFSK